MARFMGKLGQPLEPEQGFFGTTYKIEVDGKSIKVPQGLWQHVRSNFNPGSRGEFCDDDGVVSFMSEADVEERETRTKALEKNMGALRAFFLGQ